MTSAGIVALVVVALPALAFILWPLWKRGTPPGMLPLPSPDDRRDELTEEKRALYRALRELTFDHQAGHLSEDDYAALRARYEGRAAHVLAELDRLGPTVVPAPRRSRPHPASALGWARRPGTLAGGAVLLMVFGVALGLGVARYTEPDRTTIPQGSRLPVPMDAPGVASPDPSRPIAPEMLQGMLEAARSSLVAGRYQEAMAAYQAVLKRDPRNVDAMTHLGLIVAIGGHSDAALETLAKALAIDPNYAPAHLYRGQILYEVKTDYAGAIRAWERFVALVPQGEEHGRVRRLIEEARARLRNREGKR